MNCRNVKPLLTTYVDGEANGYERTLIEAHLGECQMCADEAARLRITRQRVQREIKNWAASAVPPPTAWEGLMLKITAEKESSAQSVAEPSSKPVNNRFWRGTLALSGIVKARLLKLIRLSLKLNQIL